MKACNVCKVYKPFSDFSKRNASPDGLQYKCKDCSREAKVAWDSANGEHAAEYRAAYHRANKRRSSELSRQWKARNLEKVKAYQSDWNSANKSRKAHLEMRRYASRLKATPSWSDDAQIAEFYAAADFLSMVTGEWHQVDHIVPLQSDIVCGLHNQFNLQVLTAFENRSKGNRYWPDMPTEA